MEDEKSIQTKSTPSLRLFEEQVNVYLHILFFLNQVYYKKIKLNWLITFIIINLVLFLVSLI